MNGSTRPELSIVIPVYNEAPSVAALHAGVRAALGSECELLFVDDGSTDGTRQALERLRRGDPRVRVLGFHRNRGKSLALAAGFRRARGRKIATLDGDLQDDPAELPRLLEKLDDGFDLVGGWRRERRDGFFKVLGSRVFNRAASVLSGIRLRDVNCGLKVFRREVLDDIVLAGGFHRFLPVLAHWKGYRVAEEAVRHHPRRHGRSRYGKTKSLRALIDLAVILFLMRFETRPGRFFIAAGAVSGLAGAGISTYIALLRVLTGSIQSRFPLMAFGLVLLVAGFQLFTLGLFGELLSYHFRSVRRIEPVVVEELGAGETGAGETGAGETGAGETEGPSPASVGPRLIGDGEGPA